MNKNNYETSKSECLIVFLPIFFVGFFVAVIIEAPWGMKTGETVALLIASVAFFSSLYHFNAERRHNRLSVKPYLQIGSEFDGTAKNGFYTFRVKLQNYGLGPAIISEKEMILGEVTTHNVYEEFEEWLRLVNRITASPGKAECMSYACEVNQAFDKGTTQDLLLVNFPKNDIGFMDARQIAMRLSDSIKLSIKYKSHYGETYVCNK